MSTTIVMDDDVKAWVAARVVASEATEFSLADVAAKAHKLFRVDAKRFERFIHDRCVANTAGSGDKHYNYLFKIGTGKYRMFRQGDAIEYSHAMSGTTPEVHRVPAEYKSLFAPGARFPDGVRPAEPVQSPAPVIHAAAKPAGKVVVAKKQEPAITKPAPQPPPAPPQPPALNRGLRADLSGLDEHMPANIAKRTIHDMLFLELGKVGSQLDAQDKQSFTIELNEVAGMLRTRENLLVKLPRAPAIAHLADVVIELESPGRTLYIDIVEAAYNAEDLKAHAFDAIHLKDDGKGRYAVLVFLRTPSGILQDQAEAIAYGYDFFFGVDANQVKDANKFYALKSQILQWVHGRIKPVA